MDLPPLSLSTLRLLVPPLQLMSACMWQVAQSKCARYYRKLEEFVLLVTQIFPDVMTERKKRLLILGLRAKVMFEQFDVQRPCDIQTFFERISFQTTECNEVATPEADFIKFSQSLLTGHEETGRFLQEEFLEKFCPDFDAALLALVFDFLSQLEEVLPVPSFKQASLFIGDESHLDECLKSVSHSDDLKCLLQSHQCFLKVDINVPGNLQHLELHNYSLPLYGQFNKHNHNSVNKSTPGFESTQQLQVRTENQNEGFQYASQPPASNAVPGNPQHLELHNYSLPLYGQFNKHNHNSSNESTPGFESTQQLQVRTENQNEDFHYTSQPPASNADGGIRVHPPSPARSTEVSCLNKSDTRSLATYQCPQHGKSFAYRFQLINHPQSHKAEALFKCSDCRESFKFSTSLSNHRRTSCRRASRYSCARCGEGFQSLRRKLAHQCSCETSVKTAQQIENAGEAGPIEYQESTIVGLKKDLANSFEPSDETENHHGAEDQSLPLQCSQCHLRFSEMAELNAHLISHGGEQTLDCRKCGVSFSDLPSLVDHVDKGHKRTVHKRRYKKRVSRKNYKPGTQQESDKQRLPLHCSRCTLTFTQLEELNTHMRIHGTFDCHKCGVSCSDLASLVHHVEEHERQARINPKSRKPTAVLPGDRTTSERNVKSTKKAPVYLCHLCGKICNSSSQLSSHIKTSHSEQRFPCPYCGKCFSVKPALNVHIMRHTGERPYRCSVCGKGFISVFDHQVHMRVHTGERPYCCNECGRRYVTSSHLSHHKRWHRGERPHACGECSRRFLNRYCLKKHLATHSELRLYSCPQCSKNYKQANHLRQHIKIKHPLCGTSVQSKVQT